MSYTCYKHSLLNLQTNLLRKRIFAIFLVSIIMTITIAKGDGSIELKAKEVELEWEVTFGGTRGDNIFSLVQSTDGGYALGGFTNQNCDNHPIDPCEKDSWVIKTDSNGQEEWNKTYGGTAGGYIFSIIQTTDGGYAFTGEFLKVSGKSDFWLVKTDSSGQEEWNKTYGGTGDENGQTLIQTSDEGFALLGLSNSYSAGDNDFWLVKTDSNGQEEWNNTFGGAGEEFSGNPGGNSHSLVQTTDGGYAFSGSTDSYGAGEKDMWLVKTDAFGQAEWNKTFGTVNWDQAHSIVQTPDGGYAIGGEIDGATLIKTGITGQKEWQFNFSRIDEDWAQFFDLVQTSDGGYALGGWADNDFLLVKIDDVGKEEGYFSYGGTGLDIAISMVQTADGGYALGGLTKPFAVSMMDDMYLIKTTSFKEAITTTNKTTTTSKEITNTSDDTTPFSWTSSFILLALTIVPIRKRILTK